MRSTALHGRFPIRLLAEPAIPLYTNLDSETFPIGTIKELYRLRSGIETSFRELIAFFKIKAHIHMNETTLNSQKAKHSERRVESHWEEHPVTLP